MADINITQRQYKFNVKLAGYSTRGLPGKSAYQMAVEQGYEGTEEEWIASLHGEDGADATINGVTTLNMVAGDNIELDQEGSTLTISATNTGTTDYEELENQPQINGVTLIGNKSLDDLGLQPAGDYVDDSNYVHTDNNFTTVEKTKLANLENYDDTEVKGDIAGLAISKVSTSTKVNNKALVSDITLTASDIGLGSVFLLKGSKSTVEDLPSTGNQIGDVWYVESEEVGYIWLEKSGVAQWEQLGLPIDLSNYYTKTEANALLADKQDELVSGTNIKTINNQSVLGSGNVSISGTLAEIETSGASGTFTTAQMTDILDSTKTVTILNGGEVYRIADKESTLSYRTFINVNAVSTTEMSYKAIYVNTDSTAVNYGTWSKETINPSSGGGSTGLPTYIGYLGGTLTQFSNSDSPTACNALKDMINYYLKNSIKCDTKLIRVQDSVRYEYNLLSLAPATATTTAKRIDMSFLGRNSGSEYYGITYSIFNNASLMVWVDIDEYNAGEVSAVYSNNSLTSQSFGFSTVNIAMRIPTGINYPLGMNNTTAYVPTNQYNPATKGYVDGLVGDIETLLGGI